MTMETGMPRLFYINEYLGSTTNKRVKKQMNTVFNHNINATISNKIQYSLRNTEVDQNETRYTKKFP